MHQEVKPQYFFLGWEGGVTNEWTKHRCVVKETGNGNETVATLWSIPVMFVLVQISMQMLSGIDFQLRIP